MNITTTLSTPVIERVTLDLSVREAELLVTLLGQHSTYDLLRDINKSMIVKNGHIRMAKKIETDNMALWFFDLCQNIELDNIGSMGKFSNTPKTE